MAREVVRRFVTVLVWMLLAVTVASCTTAAAGSPALPSPSAIPDPHPAAVGS